MVSILKSIDNDNINLHELTNKLQKFQFNEQNFNNGYKNDNMSKLNSFNAEKVTEKVTKTNLFIPNEKDKLFWCFYVILNGYDMYELNHTNSFSIEKQIKIETVEKLKKIKDILKHLKLKRSELENDLVNNSIISLKGLYALCLVYNINITYVYGRKFCKLFIPESNSETKEAIIIQNDKKENCIKWIKQLTTDFNDDNNQNDFLTDLNDNYWYIENIKKPLKTPASYSLSELHDICKKLCIETNIENSKDGNGKIKSKTKKQLYEGILQQL